MGDEIGHQSAHCTYRSCCDTIRIQILEWSQSCRNRKMEPRTCFNPSPNTVGTPVFQVTTRTGPSCPLPNPEPLLTLDMDNLSFHLSGRNRFHGTQSIYICSSTVISPSGVHYQLLWQYEVDSELQIPLLNVVILKSVVWSFRKLRPNPTNGCLVTVPVLTSNNIPLSQPPRCTAQEKADMWMVLYSQNCHRSGKYEDTWGIWKGWWRNCVTERRRHYEMRRKVAGWWRDNLVR